MQGFRIKIIHLKSDRIGGGIPGTNPVLHVRYNIFLTSRARTLPRILSSPPSLPSPASGLPAHFGAPHSHLLSSPPPSHGLLLLQPRSIAPSHHRPSPFFPAAIARPPPPPPAEFDSSQPPSPISFLPRRFSHLVASKAPSHYLSAAIAHHLSSLPVRSSSRHRPSPFFPDSSLLHFPPPVVASSFAPISSQTPGKAAVRVGVESATGDEAFDPQKKDFGLAAQNVKDYGFAGSVAITDESMEEEGFTLNLKTSGQFARPVVVGSINFTSTYDSRANDFESSLVARGDLYAAEASHGGSTSGNENSPLFLI
ncbi:hypothetical protein ACLOJK_018024 [Asimina triloba]